MDSILKKIPIEYIGELHDIRLIQFSVEKEEIMDRLPSSLKVRDINGRALISMVDVKLKKMRPSFFPSFFYFGYRHIAFRLLIEDKKYSGDLTDKGIFFYQSFTNKSLISLGGNLFTDYNMSKASIDEKNNQTIVRLKDKQVSYTIENEISLMDEKTSSMQKIIGSLDRAYAVRGNEVMMTLIQRQKWPIQPVKCIHFENSFFKTAKFECAFRVFEIIHYHWLVPKPV